MKLLIDIYSDYGSVLYSSSEVADKGFNARNVIDQIPTYWATTNSTTHTIRGSLAFIDSKDYICPIDSIVILPKVLPINSNVTIKLYTEYPGTPIYSTSYTTLVANEQIKMFDLPIQLAKYWEIQFTLPISTYIILSRVMFGHAWYPTYGVSGSIGMDKSGYFKGDRYRNGGTFVAPSTNYTSQKLEFSELSETACYSLLDAVSRYGSGATIVVHELVGTASLTSASIYGRVKEWGNPKKSVSQSYSISLSIEEILQ